MPNNPLFFRPPLTERASTSGPCGEVIRTRNSGIRHAETSFRADPFEESALNSSFRHAVEIVIIHVNRVGFLLHPDERVDHGPTADGDFHFVFRGGPKRREK